ncbi:MAG: phage minor head protein [Rhizobiaceae bacterium]|nr:phage minor head protein [Rhizobiaceae bacterium]MCO5083389.1 phage minor head protein [Rhizobiaceae bacterium]
MAEIAKGFSTPPEVTAYFDGKSLRPAFSWLDVWAEEHAYAFTVAKATELELLTTFRDSIGSAIRKGQGFETWKQDVLKDLTRIGWARPRMVSDPEGIDPDRMVNFGSSRRLKTIFWSNVNSARAAGQWERAQRTKRALPYLLYVRTTSADPRQEHLGWVGIILPIDHPFWRTHFPPNGWLCKCQVRQISAREAEQLLGRAPAEGGVIYRDTPPDLGPDIPFVNRRTGEVTMVPPGVDAGWHTNPGLSRSSTLLQNLEARLRTADAGDAERALGDLWADPFLRVAPKLPEKTWLPAGVSPRLASEFPAARNSIVSIATEDIVSRNVRHGMTLDEFALLPRIIADGAILPDERGDGSVRTILGRIGKTWWRLFIKFSSGGYLRVTSMHQRRFQDIQKTLDRFGLTVDDINDLGKE